MQFVKYNNFWYTYDDSTPKHSATLGNLGLGEMTEVDITDCELVEADYWTDLNWYGTPIYDDKYSTGWLAPNGKFFGCDYEYHWYQAKFVHHMTERELEQKGYIKITYIRNLGQKQTKAFFMGDLEKIGPTLQQIYYLEHKFEDQDKEDILYRIKHKRLMFLHNQEKTQNNDDENIK